MTKREQIEQEYFSAQSAHDSAMRRMNDSLRKIARLDLMERIANENDGYETKANDPECNALAKLGYVQCRRSVWNGINDREWWWLTDAGKSWLK